MGCASGATAVTLYFALAILCLLVASCAAMPQLCPAQSITAVICPVLKGHDDLTDIEADEEAESLPQGSAIYGEHVELKQLREMIRDKCGAT